jgi:hypothetical protein
MSVSCGNDFPPGALALGCPTRSPAEVARALGLEVVREDGRARWGDRLLVSALDGPQRIRLYARGIAELAEQRALPRGRAECEALAHEVLHALAPSLAEAEVSVLATRWAQLVYASPDAVADL